MRPSLNRILVLTLVLVIVSATGLVALGTGALTATQTDSDPGSLSTNASSGNGQSQTVTVYFFYGNGCPHCVIAEPVIDRLSVKYPQVDFERYEIYYNSTNQALFQQFNHRYGVQNPVVPEVYIGDKVLIAEDAIKNDLEPDIQHELSTTSSSAENSSGASTDNANSAVNSPNNGTTPAGPGGTGSEASTVPGPSDAAMIGTAVVAAAALLAIGLVIYRNKRKKGLT
ncbi:MAG: thioredoxin family protein [Methanomassiliicoccus sp.]|nr:thioredoxin family protein [Methanomassiliicoccus sp.]